MLDAFTGLHEDKRTYDAPTGRLLTSKVYVNVAGTSTLLQDLTSTWDAVGNLKTRKDASRKLDGSYRNLTETFAYDGVNRLTTSSGIPGRADLVLTYNGLGNIVTKSDVGTYVYGSSRPHAVTSAGGITYTYDANGSLVSDTSGRTLVYSAANQMLQASNTGTAVSFDYDGNRNRYKRQDLLGSASTTTHYIGAVEILTPTTGGIVETRRYIGDTVQTIKSDGSRTENYVLKDHLGSPNLIVNEKGVVLQNQSFDAFGQRRDDQAWTPLTGTQLTGFNTSITKRGYTGHEEIDSLGLIHMDGRVYDPRLGRFVSADPNVDGVATTQGFNRYSYVQNNPLNATDPSGFGSWFSDAWWNIKPYVGVVVTVVVAIFCEVCTASLANWVWTSAAIGAGNGAVQTGTLTGAATGAFTGAVSAYFGGPLTPANVLANAVAGGIAESLQGGSFGHGFLSAGLGAIAGGGVGQETGQINFDDIGMALAKITARAVVGGTVSEVTGGKFANGAISAAFAAAGEGVASSKANAGVSGLSETFTNSAGKSTDSAPAEVLAMRRAHPELVSGEAKILKDSNKDGFFPREQMLIGYQKISDANSLLVSIEPYPAVFDWWHLSFSMIKLSEHLPVPTGYRIAIIEHTHPFSLQSLFHPLEGPSGPDQSTARQYPGAFHVIDEYLGGFWGTRFIYYGAKAHIP